MKNAIIAAVAVIILLGGCRKDEPAPDKYLVAGDISPIALEYIDVEPDDTIAPAPGERLEELLDIDRDGIPEFRLIAYQNLLMNGADTIENRSCEMQLNAWGVEISLRARQDSFITYSDTLQDSQVVIYTENLSPSSPSYDFLSHEENRYPAIYALNDTIYFNEGEWDSHGRLGRVTRSVSNRSDGSLFKMNATWGNWNGQKDTYMAFRFKKIDGSSYYGWIKLTVTEHRKIIVHEYAYMRGSAM